MWTEAYTLSPEEINSADRKQNDENKKGENKNRNRDQHQTSHSLKQTKHPCTKLSLWAQSSRWWTDFKVFRDGQQYCSEGVSIAKSIENATSHQEPQFNQSLIFEASLWCPGSPLCGMPKWFWSQMEHGFVKPRWTTSDRLADSVDWHTCSMCCHLLPNSPFLSACFYSSS